MFGRLVTNFASCFGLVACFTAFPLLGFLGGSVQPVNWGLGLLAAGFVVFSLLWGPSSRISWGGSSYSVAFIATIGLLGLRAAFSPVLPAAAQDLVLMSLALAGYLVGRAQDSAQSRALMFGLLVVMVGNVTTSLIQLDRPEWSPIYPGRSATLPSGFFAHYNHAANFGLGALGLFFSGVIRAQGKSRIIPGIGVIASVLTVLLSLSRGGNLSLACIVVIGFGVFSAKVNHKNTGMLRFWIVVAAVCLLIAPVGKVVVERVAGFRGHLMSDGGFGDGGRFMFYDAALKLFIENSLVGGGAGHFGREVYRILPVDSNLGAEPDMVHNEILQLLCDYGLPCAIMLAVILIVPIARQLHRYLSNLSSGSGVWESLGLVGMLLQSNFDFVFHVAPCVFLAGLILGRISRIRRLTATTSGWNETHGVSSLMAEKYYQEARLAEQSGKGEESFVNAARDYARAFLAGRKRAEFRLIVLLLTSRDEWWLRRANDLTLRQKMRDGKGMLELTRQIVEECEKIEEGRSGPLLRRLWKERVVAPIPWPVRFRNMGVLVVAITMVAAGIRLTEISLALWNPLYQPERMSAARRFECLLAIQEATPFLGIERKALGVFIDQLYAFSSLESREYWASAYYRRILAATGGVKHDPVVALQLATVAGWTGNERDAMEFYDRAILLQSLHERVFMAHYFKAEYLHDLMLSSDAEGLSERSRQYAVLALEQFQMSLKLSRYGGVHHRRRQELMDVCQKACSDGVAGPVRLE
jgi:O-antigen ligase